MAGRGGFVWRFWVGLTLEALLEGGLEASGGGDFVSGELAQGIGTLAASGKAVDGGLGERGLIGQEGQGRAQGRESGVVGGEGLGGGGLGAGGFADVAAAGGAFERGDSGLAAGRLGGGGRGHGLPPFFCGREGA